MTGVVDTDVLIKVAHYRLLREALSVLHEDIAQIGVLAAARFMIRRRLKLSPELILELEEVLGQLQIIEPSEIEITFAAEIEFSAAKQHLELDEGESILFAVAVVRLLDWVVTGDKRAVTALSTLMNTTPALNLAAGKVICMEHLMVKMLETVDFNQVRSLVCGNRNVDKAVEICFSCTLTSVPLNNCIEGLMSYIEALRRRAPIVLAEVTQDDF